MTLPVSGAISFNDINVELGVAGTTQASLGQASYRTLAAVPSGAISMSNFYGKSNRPTASYTYTANTNIAYLDITTLSGYVAGTTDVTITVNAGVYLYSTLTAHPGLELVGGSTGDTVTLVNNGFIIGKGGNGAGVAASGVTLVAGTVGGPALKLGFNTTINNTNASAYIGGGGGGGGSAYGYAPSKTSSSGGGGAGGGNGGIASNGSGGTIAGGVGATTLGASGANGNIGSTTNASGGGGGLIIPGTTTAGPTRSSAGSTAGNGGSAGGSGPVVSAAAGTVVGASGGASNSAGGVGTTNSIKSTLGGGGGGWGASGGAATSFGLSPSGIQAATAGGKAVDLNGKTVTWVSGDTTRVYGAVS